MKHNPFNTSMVFMLALVMTLSFSCKQEKKKETSETPETEEVAMQEQTEFPLSLAQWSIHRMIWDGTDPYSFAEKAHGWGFTGLEYVSQLYNKELEAAGFSEEAMNNFVARSNAEAEKYGLTNLIIMIDGQGDLATSDAEERKSAVENHFKWVDAAAGLGCHSIRVNLSGSTDPAEWVPNAVDGLTQLATYAKDKNINIIVENHGGLSSDATLLAEVMSTVNMENCGTLPDFGNFCIRRNDPSDYSKGCAEMYDMYKGVEELMPFAKAVSAKSHNFDEAGNETDIDYGKMLQIVKSAGYSGFIGVEYEGNELSEEEGIIATRDLILREAKMLQ
ncbi:sugar phosphate isomerase/epimerase family protein [Lentiprolixibacter aurantiacus]|uniref:TIM barrel protein n=1 Tax=Lentiprolixibacter aurantiacus TaxID=2993939 RepID=A0AAE3MKA7_9FLAO|nr:TIM barrel protein [Lentiprolixibacter aurantiacus]MCX2718702.1 TIM barrel protein [Lentiprolixibacter aurantiacus]